MKKGNNKLQIVVVGRERVGKLHLVNCIFNQKDSEITNSLVSNPESNKNPLIILPNDLPAVIQIIVLDNKIGFETNDYFGTNNEISNADFIIVVLDAREELYKIETEFISSLQLSRVPFLIAVNKIEYGTNPHLISELDALEVTYFELSCKENAGIEGFRKTLIHMLPDKSRSGN